MDKNKIYELVENPGLLNEETLEELKKITVEYPAFHAARILYLRNLKVLNDPVFDEELKKAAPVLPDRKQLYHFLNSPQPPVDHSFNKKEIINEAVEYRIEEPISTMAGNRLIDKFLSSVPGKKKREKKLQVNDIAQKANELVEKSAAEQEEFVTETLAGIYLQQKKYDKALDAFEKLRLKYPEKNSYFASQIEKIIELKNI